MRDPRSPLLPTLAGAAVWFVLGLVALFVVDLTHRPPAGPIFRTSTSTALAVSR